jgi:NADPH-dependent curcumin reductase CurA
MSEIANKQVILAARPQGIPQAEHFRIVESPAPTPGDNEALVRNIYLSVDPAQRGWTNAVPNYSEPVGIGEVMRGFAVGVVIASNHSDYAPGAFVTGLLGWQEYAVTDGSGLRRVDRGLAPISTSVGILGLNGVTAYVGLLDIGAPKKGETVVVSTAAGAVGSAVGQIANIHGCRTVGITGTDQKVALCTDQFGFAAALNHHSGNLQDGLVEACPDGVDIYFDNTGGEISDAVLGLLNLHARVVLCGTAATASWDPPPQGPRVERTLLVRRARMEGFVVLDHMDRYDDAIDHLATWIRDRRLTYREEILDGIDQAPDAIAGLYRGENLGKRLIQVAPDPSRR